MLEKDTNELEIIKAINNSKNSIASGIDGIPYKVYRF